MRKKAYFCYSILYNHTMIAQPDEINDFVDELYAFVRAALTEGGEPADYHKGAVQVVDAHMRLFVLLDNHGTDEQLGIVALRELCRIDELTLEMVPDRMKMKALAHDWLRPF